MAMNEARELGWIGLGRMGFLMALRLVQAGHRLRVWNRTRSKSRALAQHGAVAVGMREQLAGVDVLFTMLSTGKDLSEVLFAPGGVIAGARPVPRIIVDCSSIGMDESSGIRARLTEHGVQFLSAPVSGNPLCVAAGQLSSVVSGPRAAFEEVASLIQIYAARGVAYAGEGELARICKIAHNLFLAALMESLMETTLLAQKAGVPRHAFLAFINHSVLGSIFTRYKAPALINLDFAPTFGIGLLRKDVDLGLAAARQLGVSMPVTAAVREVIQGHFGVAALKPDPQGYLEQDFASLLETLALSAGIRLESENVAVTTGLDE
jgi:3-hydroxyisobutyrate dehydrogenase